ncbi:MAG TPA: hypothetical protein VMX54_12305 [Vicinamibacteria bacterium]|nr:hypothetical protein [Vicinamibacteria bacterium]
MAKTKHSKDHKKKEKKEKKAAARHGKPPAKASARHKPARPKAPEKAARRPPSAKGKPDSGQAAGSAGAAPPKPPAGVDGRPAKIGKARKSSRRPTLLRRGPDGEILAPGDLLLPGGTQRSEEIQYLFRGCAAAERPNVGEEAIAEVFVRRPAGDFPSDRDELQRALAWACDRFERGNIEPVIPQRANIKRTFQGVVERARHRRREIGAFLRGLDLGHTETNHMDAHGEASLQSLMEWAARLENLTEADEPTQADYASFHRGLDQLESTTEALMIDVEQTLRRLRDRLRG